MRVSPVAFAFDRLEDVVQQARATAEVTHNHPEGIRGAEATAAATFVARQGASKNEIREIVEKQFGYDLSLTMKPIRPTYEFNESCQDTVPRAITALLESEDYQDALRLAISLGGDADTLASITGGIAGAFYGSVPQPIAGPAWELLDNRLRDVVTRFCAEFQVKISKHLHQFD